MAGPLSTLGRRLSLIIVDLISIFGLIICLLSVYSINVWFLIIGRIICGISSGFNTTLVPLYIKEVSPVCMSGKTGTYNNLFICFGMTIGVIMGLGI